MKCASLIGMRPATMPSIAKGAIGTMRTANTAATPRLRNTPVMSSIFDPASRRKVSSGNSRPA